jgi:hypothetical protein
MLQEAALSADSVGALQEAALSADSAGGPDRRRPGPGTDLTSASNATAAVAGPGGSRAEQRFGCHRTFRFDKGSG